MMATCVTSNDDESLISRDVFKVISYNLHGFNQGVNTITDLISDLNVDVIAIQEHWLSPANFDSIKNYFFFGSSAMTHAVETGILRGRPFGGVGLLVSNKLRHITRSIMSNDRIAVISVDNLIICSVYFPCSGSPDRELICGDIIDNLINLRLQYPNSEFIIAGDFNTDLNSNDSVANAINNFVNNCSLFRCDCLAANIALPTFCNSSFRTSTIDFMLSSTVANFIDFVVLDPDVNFSDHSPIMGTFIRRRNICQNRGSSANAVFNPVRLRWDKADINKYYNFTRTNLEPL